MMKWPLRIAGVVLGLLVVAVGILAAMSQRESAGLSQSTIEIAAPPEVVWAWIDETDKFKQWVSWVVAVEPKSPPEVTGVGRKAVVVMNEPGSSEAVRIETVCTEYQPHSKYSAEVEFPGLFTGTQTYRLTSLEGGRTRVDLDSRIHYTSALIRLFEPLATPSSTQKLDTDFATLKRLVEAAR